MQSGGYLPSSATVSSRRFFVFLFFFCTVDEKNTHAGRILRKKCVKCEAPRQVNNSQRAVVYIKASCRGSPVPNYARVFM